MDRLIQMDLEKITRCIESIDENLMKKLKNLDPNLIYALVSKMKKEGLNLDDPDHYLLLYKKLEERVKSTKLNLDNLVFEDSLANYLLFNKSLDGLRERDYFRLPRIDEFFLAYIDYTKNKNSRYKAFFEGIITESSYTTIWASAVCKWYKGELTVAIDPENLIFDEEQNDYVISNDKNELECLEKETFELDPTFYQEFVSFRKLPKNLIKFLFGNSYKDFPKEITFNVQHFNNHNPNFDPLTIGISPAGFKISTTINAKSFGVRPLLPKVTTVY